LFPVCKFTQSGGKSQKKAYPSVGKEKTFVYICNRKYDEYTISIGSLVATGASKSTKI